MECHVHLLCSPAKAPFSPSADNRTHSWGLGGADSVLQAQFYPKKGLHDSSFSDWLTYRPMTLLGTCSAKTMWEDVLLLLGCAAGRVWVLGSQWPTYAACISETLHHAEPLIRPIFWISKWCSPINPYIICLIQFELGFTHLQAKKPNTRPLF